MRLPSKLYPIFKSRVSLRWGEVVLRENRLYFIDPP
jgi:hypothetical protein